MVGVVLAGGHGRRMGGVAKALIELNGIPLGKLAIDALRAGGCDEVALVAPETVDLSGLDAPVWIEPDDGPRHPARGLLAALTHTDTYVVLACDGPFVPPSLIRTLRESPPGRVRAARQPLIARYSQNDAGDLRALLRDGGRLRDLPATELDLAAFGDPTKIGFNINHPDDLRLAELLDR